MQEILKTPKIIYPHIKKVLVIGMMVGLIALLTLSPSNGVFATGNGSIAECDSPNANLTGNGDLLFSTAPGENIINGVCIKSGNNMFGNNNHSTLLGNGTYENGCYQVSGVGTTTVSIQRIGAPSDTCQELSHVDVFYSIPIPTPSPTPISSPTPAPSSTPTPSVEPTPSPTLTPTPSSSPSPASSTTNSTPSSSTPANTGSVLGASAVSTNDSSPALEGAVLGASAELPATGIETVWPLLGIFSFLSGAGLILLGLI